MEKTYPVIDRQTITMRWGDMDAVGHLNNTYYFRYLEQIRLNWLESMGHSINPQGRGPVLASTGFLHDDFIQVHQLACAINRSVAAENLFQQGGACPRQAQNEDRIRRLTAPALARCEELGAMIFLHPAGFTDTSRISKHFLANVIGNPLDTTLALNHLVFGGVLERHPKLKFVAAHGGGYAGHYPARMDHAYRVRPECHDFITKTPNHYMKKFYYDTMVFSHTQLEHLVNLWGADHVVIGTDYPYDMGYYKPVDFVNASKKLTRKQKDQIIGGNAAKLLGWKVPKKAR